VVRLGTALSPDEAISWAPDGSFVVLSGPFGRAIYQNKQLVGVNPITGARRALSHDGRWADVEPAVSPDGKQIAFARGRSGLSTRLTPVQLIASRRLIVMDADGTHPHRLTAAPGWTDEAPVWSPDGQSLLFVRWRRHRQGQAAEATLWAVRADGTDAQRLAQLDLPGGFLNGFGYYGAFGWRGLFAVAPS
jgi:TolB protein